MANFSFVILHYNTIDDTYACVSSIEKMCKGSEYRIYIVDNASPNQTGTVLANHYQNDKISVIKSQENLGFAKGNNLGIIQAEKDGFNDYVVVLNNDTKIIQTNFLTKIEEEYARSKFAVLGPTIYTPKGKSDVNPGRTYIKQGPSLDKCIFQYKKQLFLNKWRLDWLSSLLRKIHCRHNSKGQQLDKKGQFKYTQNCLLHGCCLIFSKKYLDVMHGFDPRTFLYFEEDILYLHCMKLGLKTVYNPEIEIWHKEDSATDSMLKSPRKKRVFIYSNILKSIYLYKMILEEYKEKENKNV